MEKTIWRLCSTLAGIGLAFAISGIAHAAELNVQADADAAGDGLATNTDGAAVVPVLITKEGVPVSDLVSTSLSFLERFSLTAAKSPVGVCGSPRLTRVDTQRRGIYLLYLGAPRQCQPPVGAPLNAWKKGTYVLGIHVTKSTFSITTNTYVRDDGSTLATLVVP